MLQINLFNGHRVNHTVKIGEKRENLYPRSQSRHDCSSCGVAMNSVVSVITEINGKR